MFRSIARTTIGLLLASVLSLTACEDEPAAPTISIHEAARQGDVEQIEAHIAAGTDLDKHDENNATPLFEAMAFGELDAASALLEAGAGIDTPGPHERTALHWMAQTHRAEETRFLLERGASVDARDENGFTPLHYATMVSEFVDPAEQHHFRDTLDLLLEHGTDLEARADYDMTPLHAAVRYGDVQIVQELIGRGADVNAHLANSADALGLAISAHPEDSQKMHRVLEVLVDAGADVNYQRTPNEATALHSLAWMGAGEAVGLLLRNGADPNLRNMDGDTALHAACRGGQPGLVSMLVMAGADPHAVNNAGKKPIDLAPPERREAIQRAIDDALQHQRP